MARKSMQEKMYGLKSASRAQRAMLAVLFGALVAMAWWLLMARGVTQAGIWLGQAWHEGDSVRRMLLAVGFTVYYGRFLLAGFVFLKRGISWSEVFSIAPWLLVIVLLLSVEGGMNANPAGAAMAIGAGLFVFGSWMNTHAEWARHAWKQQPEHRGRLYTEGWFRWTRHPNYLGDVISFSGMCLIAGAWWTAVIPIVMLAGFVFFNIPILDAHLREHYGPDFEEYARRTKKLVPFVY